MKLLILSNSIIKDIIVILENWRLDISKFSNNLVSIRKEEDQDQ